MAGIGDIGLAHIQSGGFVILAGQADQRIGDGSIVHAAVGGLVGEAEGGLALRQHIEHGVTADDLGRAVGTEDAVLGIAKVGFVQGQGNPAFRGGEPRLPDIGARAQDTQQLIAAGITHIGIQGTVAITNAAGHVHGQRHDTG